MAADGCTRVVEDIRIKKKKKNRRRSNNKGTGHEPFPLPTLRWPLIFVASAGGVKGGLILLLLGKMNLARSSSQRRA
jgi:hypothetical protein